VFAASARERFASGAVTGESQAFFAAGTQTIEAVTAYQRSAVAHTNQLLQTRLDSTTRMFWLTTVGSGLCVLTMLYLMLSFNISFLTDLRQVQLFLQQTAGGNLRHQARMLGKDELSEMSDVMNSMVNTLSSMVASVRSNAALVAHAGSSMAAGNRALSERTEQQAANLEQTAASVEELSSTVHGNAQAAQSLITMASGVRDGRERCAQAMAERSALSRLFSQYQTHG
jgi:methyl-accepting chemotaxis protein